MGLQKKHAKWLLASWIELSKHHNLSFIPHINAQHWPIAWYVCVKTHIISVCSYRVGQVESGVGAGGACNQSVHDNSVYEHIPLNQDLDNWNENAGFYDIYWRIMKLSYFQDSKFWVHTCQSVVLFMLQQTAFFMQTILFRQIVISNMHVCQRWQSPAAQQWEHKIILAFLNFNHLMPV